MSHKQYFVGLTILLTFFVFTGIAFGNLCSKNQDQKPKPPDGGIGLFTKEVHEQLMAEALSEISGKNLTEAREACKGKHIPEILRSNNIEPRKFRSLMQEKMIAIVNEAVLDKKIDQEKADEIIDRIKNQAGPPKKGNCAGHNSNGNRSEGGSK